MKSSNQWVTPKYYTFIFLFVFQTFPNVLIKRILFFVFSVAITAITKLHLTRNKMRSQAQSCEIIFSKCMCAYCIMCSTAREFICIFTFICSFKMKMWHCIWMCNITNAYQFPTFLIVNRLNCCFGPTSFRFTFPRNRASSMSFPVQKLKINRDFRILMYIQLNVYFNLKRYLFF